MLKNYGRTHPGNWMRALVGWVSWPPENQGEPQPTHVRHTYPLTLILAMGEEARHILQTNGVGDGRWGWLSRSDNRWREQEYREEQSRKKASFKVVWRWEQGDASTLDPIFSKSSLSLGNIDLDAVCPLRGWVLPEGVGPLGCHEPQTGLLPPPVWEVQGFLPRHQAPLSNCLLWYRSEWL